jgi:hypothetical protein
MPFQDSKQQGLEKNLSARRETGDAELPKFGENLLAVVIPSQARPIEPGRCRD